MSIVDARIVFQLLTAERTPECLMTGVEDDTLWRTLLTAEEDVHLMDLAMNHMTDFSTLSVYHKIRIGRTVIRKHGLSAPVTEAFRGHLMASIPSRQDQRTLWLTCQGLAAYDYECPGWLGILWRQESCVREEARQRALAATRAAVVATFTDEQLYDYLYRQQSHCEECECIEVSMLSKERVQTIREQVQEQRTA